jgi:riboflavin kinase/FMN adenylyltransferase
VHDAQGPISSSRIRKALKAGDCAAATRMLTRPFAIRGRVQHGDKRGRTIGFPTANLELGTYLRPRYGIYAVTGVILSGPLAGGRVIHGAANMGVRPTFDPPVELLEPFFFDFSGDLYGEEIEVGFHHFLRPEAKFSSLEELTAQMERDCEEAKARLAALQV